MRPATRGRRRGARCCSISSAGFRRAPSEAGAKPALDLGAVRTFRGRFRDELVPGNLDARRPVLLAYRSTIGGSRAQVAIRKSPAAGKGTGEFPLSGGIAFDPLRLGSRAGAVGGRF